MKRNLAANPPGQFIGGAKFPRSSGVLLHPTSLPGRFGIGDIGPDAYRFVDFLAEAKQQIWQVLPLGPTGYGNSPYQCFSAFAGNPLLISPEKLVERGYLTQAECSDIPPFSLSNVEFHRVIPYKLELLRKAFAGFKETEDYREFEQMNRFWLDSFAHFMALKNANGGVAWIQWDASKQADEADIRLHKFLQFEFFHQWGELKERCRQRNIRIMGDISFYVQHDSADVWGHPELFHLNERGYPERVGGVPPDYFSPTGQLWGTPVYRWDNLEATGYQWWIERLRQSRALFDWIRLDHFRGFQAYWEVPASEETAVNGKWVLGPGAKLFDAAHQALGEFPIVAEDLGYITPEVEALREKFSFPGMKVLQFAFGGDSTLRPHNYPREAVAYTGTHDNETALGWWRSANESDSTSSAQQSTSANAERNRAAVYLGINSDKSDIAWAFIRGVMTSVADTAIIPLQDILGLGNEARLNLPGSASGNWGWRYQADALTRELADRLKTLTELCDRHPD